MKYFIFVTLLLTFSVNAQNTLSLKEGAKNYTYFIYEDIAEVEAFLIRYRYA